MARGEEPLLARPSSEQSNSVAEEDALLTGQRVPAADRNTRWAKLREIAAFTWAIAATILVVIFAVNLSQQKHHEDLSDPKPNGKRNLIFMVSDGMGPTSLSLTRSFRQFRDSLPWNDTLVIDKHHIGQSRTRSSSSLVTDSAAGATAFSCGQKSYNGAISMLPDHTPCGTVMEAAKRAGYMTGLVVTTRITDATPACFAAHVNRRLEEDTIASHLIGDYPLGHVVDLMLGGGRCHFLSNTTDNSCRDDDKDIIKQAEKKGYTYISTRKEFDGLSVGSSVKLPLLGLFADHDIPFEIDRVSQNDQYPSLAEMAKVAMRALSDATRDSEKGFFLMVEGSRIDHAGHINDPAGQVHEVLAYDAAMEEVLSFLEKDNVPGVMVSTSDHETGGLSTAKQLNPWQYPQYLWYPEVLANASHSSEWMTQQYAKFMSSKPSKKETLSYLKDAISTHLSIHDVSDDELSLLIDKQEFALWVFADIISRRAQTGWSTHGHSGVDVNIYASDLNAARALAGDHENTEVGDFLRDYLDVDTVAITKELRKAGTTWNGELWMGSVPEEDERLDGQAHLDHYAGDFKHRKRCEICGV